MLTLVRTAAHKCFPIVAAVGMQHLMQRGFCSSPSNQCESDMSTYTPRRAVLYVPGNDERKLNKIAELNVDCAVMDCEDGVAASKKEEARHTICKMLDTLDTGTAERVVRVNSIGSGLAEEDLSVIFRAKKLPQTVMFPKVESTSEVDKVAELMSAVPKHADHAPYNIVLFVESARSLLDLDQICCRADEVLPLAGCRLDGVVFGSDDFCADIGAQRTEAATELLYARQRVVLVAKAHKTQAIDLVYINYKDLDGLRRQSVEGAAMGFTGKQVIHPGQIPIVQEIFSPSDERIEFANELVKAFEEHQKSGKGAFVFRGSMIDMPLVLQARNIQQLAAAIRGTRK